MLNKRTLLASSALAVLASVGSAQADGGFYISVHGAANFQPQNDANFTISCCQLTSHHLDSHVGFLLGAEVGVHLDNWLHGLRAGIESDYRRNKIGGRWLASSISEGPTSGRIDGHQSTFSVLANVWYDIDVGQKWVPYVGGGAGWGRTKVSGGAQVTSTSGGGNTSVATTWAVEESGFAYQLGAGINYPIQPGVNLGLGYRFFKGPEIKNNVFLGKNDIINFQNENHSVLINLTVDVN
ncbi:MAG: outer membrane beta-barrel protein [Alphaproteobacteria bacterium]|nr:outer membrane beta-barrel protein [Alphaproteobacteria bacterium]